MIAGYTKWSVKDMDKMILTKWYGIKKNTPLLAT